MSFADLDLNPAIMAALTDAGYTEPTDVQAQTIPAALTGCDLRVCSNTGSGKTAAFVIPALHRVLAARQDPNQRRPRGEVSGPRVLVLAPTRELALQVAKAASNYGRHIPGLKVATVVGGVPYGAQLAALRKPLDLLIATPGRLIDHLDSGKAILASVEMLVLDEADRMLDMGFIEDIERIAESLPASRQTVMVSATFAGQVGRLADQILKPDAQRIEIANHTDSHENITQKLYWADSVEHKAALLEHLLTDREVQQAVVFTSTQRDADELAAHLYDIGHAVAPLHGGMPQGRRTRTLMALRSGELKVLVATDVAARGIDVPTISHVINFGLPMKAEDYVHRIGRTGRAGRSGLAITLAERRDAGMIRRIMQFTTQIIPIETVVGLEPTRPGPDLASRPARPAFDRRPGGAPRRHDERGGPRAGGWNNDRGGRPAHAGHNGDRPAHAGHAPGFGHAPEARVFDRPHGDRPHGHAPRPAGGEWRGAAPARGPGGPNRGFRPAPQGRRGDR
ncbi:DEAD/DEAH box helicase [Sphaerotilus mobilis]|uniref:Superfamily II DNA/RNA helicase n=1 Tax=Sphaerotilus mobilis TaxID=47994 RepID=A0A4Q7LRE1_9BURK|nr:DEAD/DEAH box helicase [Sphaerotilus mobilis]RZS57021.1 superfamily II DNA/RNA helicase [Sphaerotilus mobilis]